MMFVIRDALKYMGLFPDKQQKPEMTAAWQLKTEEYKMEFLTQKSKELSSLLH